MQVNYRELSVKDVSECIDLFTEMYATQTLEDYLDLVEGFRNDSIKSKADICEAIEYGVMSGYVAKVEDEIIGFILLTKPNYIRKLAVKKEFQNKGIASTLIEMCEDGQNTLVVHAAEKVIPFYEKVGFTKNGEMNRDKYPYLPMQKNIDNI